MADALLPVPVPVPVPAPVPVLVSVPEPVLLAMPSTGVDSAGRVAGGAVSDWADPAAALVRLSGGLLLVASSAAADVWSVVEVDRSLRSAAAVCQPGAASVVCDGWPVAAVPELEAG